MHKQDKPRICEVLGVEVGERFEFTDDNLVKYQNLMVCDDGIIFRIRPDGVRGSRLGGRALCYAINHPECIVRRKRFTAQEIEDAKAIKRLVACSNGICRENDGLVYILRDIPSGPILRTETFQTIAPGESYTLDEIIGEGTE